MIVCIDIMIKTVGNSLTKFESSTSFLIWGLTNSTISTICLLVGTVPKDNAKTLLPMLLGPSFDMLLSYFVFFAGGKSLSLFRTMGSGTGMFKSWCTSAKARSLNSRDSNNLFNVTIISGNPLNTNASAFVLTLSL